MTSTSQNLILNILSFRHPQEQKDFSFSLEKKDGWSPLYRGEWPLNIHDIIPETDTAELKYLYTDFSANGGDSSLQVDLTKSKRFGKHYYSWLIFNYFTNVADVVNSNFVKDLEVWFKEEDESTENYNGYRVFTIRVQIALNTNLPELVISYDGISLVHKKSIQDLDIDTTLLKRVVYTGIQYKYKFLPDEAKYHWDEVFPVLNNQIKYALNIPVSPPNPGHNRYKVYKAHIDAFIKNYLLSNGFSKLIPLVSPSFYKIDVGIIKNTSPESNRLQFGQNKTDIVPYNGLKAYGPYAHCPYPHIKIFVICHESEKEDAKKLFSYFRDGYKNVPKLKEFLQVPLNISKEDSITYTNLQNPFPEIAQALFSRQFDPNVRHLAIYLSHYSKHDPDIEHLKFYYQIKEELLKYNITSQVIETRKISEPNFNFNLVNIAIAILAKVGGVPWRLHRTVQNELVVGVGAFRSADSNNRYIGSAFCFSNDGHFKGFECYAQNDMYKLAGSISKAILHYQKQHTEVNRLIIHFYKTMSDFELKPIRKELNELDLDIPVIVITINKTESKDLVLFDLNCPELIPVSGTFISIGRNQYLLCNNTRYEQALPRPTEGYPFPIKLSISSTDKKILENETQIKELIDQVYQFSRMYWKSVRQQNLPVTIKYPEMVAEIFPHFESNNIPDFGKNNLWFL